MFSIVVAFQKTEDAIAIRKLLQQNGVEVAGICTSGAQTIALTNELDGGIVICGYRFPDMHFKELKNYLPNGFQMLLVTSAARILESVEGEILALSLPLRTKELLGTIEMMQHQTLPRRRGEKRERKENEVVLRAKTLLMERNGLTEPEAYRYIQKASMDSGTNMAEMAEMILLMM